MPRHRAHPTMRLCPKCGKPGMRLQRYTKPGRAAVKHTRRLDPPYGSVCLFEEETRMAIRVVAMISREVELIVNPDGSGTGLLQDVTVPTMPLVIGSVRAIESDKPAVVEPVIPIT